MQIVPRSVGLASRAWDEQHLELESATRLVASADTAGFTTAVAGPARRFTSAWGQLVNATGNTCEAQADALRGIIVDAVTADDGAALSALALREFVEEVR